jgi:hypothetical protein
MNKYLQHYIKNYAHLIIIQLVIDEFSYMGTIKKSGITIMDLPFGPLSLRWQNFPVPHALL